jgi:hypothetical protein
MPLVDYITACAIGVISLASLYHGYSVFKLIKNKKKSTKKPQMPQTPHAGPQEASTTIAKPKPQATPKHQAPDINQIEVPLLMNITDAKSLCKFLMDIKLESIEIFYDYYSFLRSAESEEADEILSKFNTEYFSMIEITCKKYGCTLDKMEELKSLYKSDPDVDALSKEINDNVEELRNKKCPSIFKPYIDKATFVPLYSKYLFFQWQAYYAEYQLMLKNKSPDANGKVFVSKEDFYGILKNMATKCIAEKICAQNGVSNTQANRMSYDYMIHCTFFYILMNDVINSNQLTFLNNINKAIYSLINKGVVYEEFNDDPSTIAPEEATNRFNAIVKKLQEYFTLVKQYSESLHQKEFQQAQEY